jgi:hypothetical protein
MKKIFLCVLATCLSLTLFPVLANAASDKVPSSIVGTKPTEPVDSTEAKTLLLRVDEINKMDKTTLNASEKKSLRKEVKSINNRLRDSGGYVYLSVGAVILIVILLIVLL